MFIRVYRVIHDFVLNSGSFCEVISSQTCRTNIRRSDAQGYGCNPLNRVCTIRFNIKKFYVSYAQDIYVFCATVTAVTSLYNIN
jgi:hypothetical protein